MDPRAPDGAIETVLFVILSLANGVGLLLLARFLKTLDNIMKFMQSMLERVAALETWKKHHGEWADREHEGMKSDINRIEDRQFDGTNPGRERRRHPRTRPTEE